MIVFDASTLILLAKAGLLERFLEASGLKALIPREVAREACEEKQSFDALLIARLIGSKKIAVESLRDRKFFEKIRVEMALGTGEAEAIALAVARGADLVATDDRSAINACKLVGLRFTTALAMLVRMHENGWLDRNEALLKLETLGTAGRYKKSLIAAAIAQLR